MGKRIVLIGAGSAMFGLGALGDIFKCSALEGSTVVLHDIDETALNKVASVTRQFIDETQKNYKVVATTSRKEALKGADFCIISIEVGERYKLWSQDWNIPLQLGIPQVYGENGGPGGIFHALRIIPPILDICEDIERICPEALIICLSNPVSTICLAVSRRHPGLKLIGLCHEISLLIKQLPQILGTDFSNLAIKAGGLNHFSVLTEAKYKNDGRDAYPDIREKAPAFYESLPEHGLNRTFLRIYGCLPITTDSHFGEYIPWAQDAADHQGILDFYQSYKHACTKPIDAFKRLSHGTRPTEYWRSVSIIEGLLTDSKHEELAVNVRNDGCIACLPDDIYVEVPAMIDVDGVHGMKLTGLPIGFEALLSNRIGVLRMTVEAVLNHSKAYALQALLSEPVVNSLDSAEKLLVMMLRYQKPYLGYLK